MYFQISESVSAYGLCSPNHECPLFSICMAYELSSVQLLLFSVSATICKRLTDMCMQTHTLCCHGDLPSVLSHYSFPQPKIKACYVQKNITQECFFAYEHYIHRSILKPFTLIFTAYFN